MCPLTADLPVRSALYGFTFRAMLVFERPLDSVRRPFLNAWLAHESGANPESVCRLSPREAATASLSQRLL